MSFFDFFERIYCINLDTRPDRWNKVAKVFEQLWIADRVTRFPAIRHSKNWHVWCMLSHRAILEEVSREKLANVLVFEDDIVFNINYVDELWQFNLLELPWDWDLLYLSWTFMFQDLPKIQSSCGNFYRIEGVRSTSAIAYSWRSFDPILKLIPKDKASWELFLESEVAIDVFFSRKFSKLRKCYVTKCLLFSQEPGDSDIKWRFVNYEKHKHRFLVLKLFYLLKAVFTFWASRR